MQDSIELANNRADELIIRAETIFGPMTSPWRYEGVIFQDIHPHLSYCPREGVVRISLSYKCLEDMRQMDFQLAHEVCHLLYPAVPFNIGAEPDKLVVPPTNIINEGISTYFSIHVICELYGKDVAKFILQNMAESSTDYYYAFDKVSDLIDKDPEAIKKIRLVNPMINEVTVEEIRSAEIFVSEELIGILVSPFCEIN